VGLYNLEDPEPVAPSKGCCFRATGVVMTVKDGEVVLHLKKEDTRYNKGWEKDMTVRLAEGVETPEEGGKYMLRWTVTPFALT